MLVDRKGRVKICDFGISGYLVNSIAKTIDAGCKPYMAVSTAIIALLLIPLKARFVFSSPRGSIQPEAPINTMSVPMFGP